jgi:CO/xanthine dehydrogenase FAD-binding subunit
MKPAPFRYHDPKTLDDVVGLLATEEEAKLLAGGQSLVPMLNFRFVQPDDVIDLNGVDDLFGTDDDGARLRIGAMTRQSSLMESTEVGQRLPIMVEALEWVGHFQTRSRGTIGGSLCNLDPAAELPVVALLYDAELSVRGPDGFRKVPATEWPLAYMLPSISPDEVLASIAFPYWRAAHGYAFAEFARRHGDFAIVAIGCLLAVEDGKISRAAIAVGGAREVPYRLTACEDALLGQPATTETFKAAAAMARAEETMSDAYISAAYRQRLASVLTERALATAAARARN